MWTQSNTPESILILCKCPGWANSHYYQGVNLCGANAESSSMWQLWVRKQYNVHQCLLPALFYCWLGSLSPLNKDSVPLRLYNSQTWGGGGWEKVAALLLWETPKWPMPTVSFWSGILLVRIWVHIQPRRHLACFSDGSQRQFKGHDLGCFPLIRGIWWNFS